MNQTKRKKDTYGYYECPRCTWLFGKEKGDSTKCPKCGCLISDVHWTDATDAIYDLLEDLHLLDEEGKE